MNNPAYQAIIRSATETRNIDFKASMNWLQASKCARFEILCDIAAMSNVGGGYLIIGRDEPGLDTGSLTGEQANSFDPTEVNKLVRRFLAPAIECRVEPEVVGKDTLVVIEVPGFDSAPVIFQLNGDCGVAECRRKPHFKIADIYVRTKQQQSQRVDDADDMRDILKRGMLNARDDLLTSIQRALSSQHSVEEPLPVSPYDEEEEHDQADFFLPTMFPWVPHIGHFDLTVKPVAYKNQRLDLLQIPRRIREYCYIVHKNGASYAVPYPENHEVNNVSGGCRMTLANLGWRHYEAVSLRESGLYRIVRIFLEDYKPNEDRSSGSLIEQGRTLWLDTFVEQMTMLHLLARNIGRDLLDDPNEEIQIDLRVDGLAGRTVTTDEFNPEMRARLAMMTSAGTENVFKFPLRTTLRQLEVDVVSIARERCAKILWTFGLKGDGLATYQRRILRNSEPIAFPPYGSEQN